ncbi:MAG: hypothetical protein U9R14_00060 [Patescibacteria group bacterium]|nr:hypothetical protein [Patescibacteria group bacterium]
MNKLFKQILILIFLIALLVLPYFVFADSAALEKLEGVGTGGGYADANIYTMSIITGTAVKAFLSLLGIIFIILIIYAGYEWMTAGGNEEKLTKAKETLWQATIGLIIVVGTYAIWRFILIYFIYGGDY